MENVPDNSHLKFTMLGSFTTLGASKKEIWGSANYFTYLDEAYMGYLEEIGFSWDELARHNLETYYVSADCQFMGRAWEEHTLLRVAAVAEQHVPRRPPKVHYRYLLER